MSAKVKSQDVPARQSTIARPRGLSWDQALKQVVGDVPSDANLVSVAAPLADSIPFKQGMIAAMDMIMAWSVEQPAVSSASLFTHCNAYRHVLEAEVAVAESFRQHQALE